MNGGMEGRVSLVRFGALICLPNDMHYPGDRCFLFLFWRKLGITAWVSSSSWALQRDNRSEDNKSYFLTLLFSFANLPFGVSPFSRLERLN
jgi:hypothetical protein